MESSGFDGLSKTLVAEKSRRSLAQVAIALVNAGIPVVQSHDIAEGKRKKKRTHCLKGQTITRPRSKQKKLLALGATIGKCPCTTCEALNVVCGPANDGCGGSLQCGTCSGVLGCCAGQCVNLQTDNNNCGTCGNVCDITQNEGCAAGLCVQL